MRSLSLTKILSFHIDYLEIYGTFRNIKSIQKWLDFDNSNISSFGDFICMYSDARNYKSKVTFIKDNVPCFAYYEWVQVSELITTKNYFIVYGKAFRVFSVEEILAFIEEHLDMGLIKRLDLALDVSEDIEFVLHEFSELSQKWARIYGEGWKIQTYYIWEKQNRYNRSLLIRIYDKIADIQTKWLQRLYPEYLQEDWVTRMELEFRVDLCRSLIFGNLKDKDYLFRLFVTYIERHTTIFKGLKTKKVDKLIQPKKKLDTKNKSYVTSIPKRYISAFLGYSRNIMKLWWCPIDILLRNDIVRLSTVQNLNTTMKNGRISILSYKFWLEWEEIPKQYLRPEYQSHPLYDSYISPKDILEDLDIPF